MNDFNPAKPEESPPVFYSHMSETTPLAIEQLDILLRLIAAAKEHVKSFACLGTDLSVLTGAIMDEHPYARGLVVDFASDPTGVGRRQLPVHEQNLSFAKSSHSGSDCQAAIARFAPLDAVILGSQLRICSTERRTLFTDIFRLLNPGGILLCVGEVPSATRWTESPLDDYLIEAIFSKELRDGKGKNRREIAREYFARVSDDETALAPLEVQCDWLQEAGFTSVDCYSKVAELTVFGGQRPAAGG
jgi:tRNA (cmo5U34)-methyltransferase